MTIPTAGVITSLVTPFSLELTDSDHFEAPLDEFHFQSLVRWQFDAGIRAVATAGWLGEGPTLTREERVTLVEIAVAVAKGRMSVLAHVGSSDTAKSALYARDAEKAGADALVVVTPPYNKPNVAGFRLHVESIARAADLPIFLEFDAARTRVSMSVHEMAQLAAVDGVVGIIDHSANPMHVECLSACRKPISFFAAHEPSSVASRVFGANGVFSGIANVAPATVLEMAKACDANDFDAARQVHERLLPLVLAVEDEGVAALKYAMVPELGMDPAVRLPLVPLCRSARTRIREVGDALTMRAAMALPHRAMEAAR